MKEGKIPNFKFQNTKHKQKIQIMMLNLLICYLGFADWNLKMFTNAEVFHEYFLLSVRL